MMFEKLSDMEQSLSKFIMKSAKNELKSNQIQQFQQAKSKKVVWNWSLKHWAKFNQKMIKIQTTTKEKLFKKMPREWNEIQSLSLKMFQKSSKISYKTV